MTHIVLGATGNVGSAVANALIAGGERVIVVTRNPSKARSFAEQGARIAEADVHDVEALRAVFRQGQRLFLLNPPGDPSKDAAAEERESLAAILLALEGSGLEKVVAESTYGARPGDHVGDLGTLYAMEQALAAQPILTVLLRAAYYMSNWNLLRPVARDKGRLPSFYPADFALPMIAPPDIGRIAARYMTEPTDRTGLFNVEGPQRYSPNDVARAFSTALNKVVCVVPIPRLEWTKSLKAQGFSEASAASFVNMTTATLAGDFPPLDQTERGNTTLADYLLKFSG